MSEPDFISQTSDARTSDERREWWFARAREAMEAGATWHRYSFHEETGAILHEAWKERPADQGEPRWQFAGGEA